MRASAMRAPLLVLAACAAAAAGPQADTANGGWGNVLGTREAIPDGVWESDPMYRKVLAFAEEGIHERWGRCRECSHVGRPEVEAVVEATQQVVSFTKDGKEVHMLPLMKWTGEVAVEPLYLGVAYTLVLRVVLAEAAAMEKHASDLTEGDRLLGAAYRTTRHRMSLHGDRNGLFSITHHTWEAGADGGGASPYAVLGDEAVTPLAGAWYGVTRPAGLSVVCYNLWNFNNPWFRRLELIARGIEAGPVPDIMAFQEVRHDNAGDALGTEATRHQVDHLVWRLERLGLYQVVWAPAMSYAQLDQGLATQTEGPALMTRLPVLGVDSIYLTRHWPEDEGDEHQRLCLAVTVDTPLWGAVNVLTTHLTLSEDARMSNVHEICEWAKQHKEATILMGDLNMIPSDPAMEYLLGAREYKGSTCDFKDVWLTEGVARTHELGDKHVENGYTFNNLNAKLEKRIDFILVRGGVDLDAYDVAMEVFGARSKQEDQIPPSDHMGLRLVVKEKEKGTGSDAASPADEAAPQEEL